MSALGRRPVALKSLTRPRVSHTHAGWAVLIATIGLVLLGVHCIGLAQSDEGPWRRSLAGRQTVLLFIGLAAGTMVAIPHYRLYLRLAWPALVGVVGLLVFLVLPFVPEAIVTPRNGARCWINLGFTDLQPSELGKIAYVLVLAWYLRNRSNYRTLAGLVPPALISMIPMGLILLQPDLGTAMLFIPTLVAMLVAAGAKMRHMLGACGLGLACALVVIGISLALAQRGAYPLLRPYQVDRIAAVLDRVKGDERQLDARGFQGRQAMVVAGAGGVLGQPQARSRALIAYSGLPERHNDMIFAVLVNRFGLLGGVGALGLYLLWIFGALAVAASCKEPFGRLVVVGLAAMVATQMTINVGMNVGLLPITGITLPFVSYGGSSLVAGCVMVGLIFNVAMRRPPYLWRKSFEYDQGHGAF